MPDVELAPDGGPDDGPLEVEDEEARQFILKVKTTIERCLDQRMNKEEMFRVIREEGLPPWIAFAVFKELRVQNYGFFKEYYSMHDLNKQREKLGRLVQAYRTGGGNAAAGARALETVTTAAAMMETDTTASMEWSDQQTELALFDGEPARLASSIGGGDQFAGAGMPQQAVHFPGGQQPHDDQQMVYNNWLLERSWAEEAVPMLAGQQLHNDEQSVANGMFQGVAWPQQAAHLPPGQQLQYQQEQAAHLPPGQQLQYQQEQAVHLPAGQQLQYQQEQTVHLPAGQYPPYLEQAVYFPADQQPRYQEQALQLAAGQQQHYQEQDLPARQQLHYQQEVVHLPAEQQLIYHQEQPMDNGGLQGAPPLTLVAGLPSNTMMDVPPLTLVAGLPGNTMMDPWTLSQDGIRWGQEQQAEPQRQWWPGVGGDGGVGADPSPSSTLPGGELLGNQNFGSSDAGFHDYPQ